MENSSFWACVMNLCRTFASLPVHVYDSVGGRHEIVRKGITSDMLKRPCPYMTWYQWQFVMTFNYELFGVAYAILSRSSVGDVIAAYPVSPRLMTSVWAGGILSYRYSPTGQIISSNDLLIVRNTPTGYSSVLSPIDSAEKDLNVANSSRNLLLSYFRRGSVIGGIVTVPRNTGDDVKKQLHAMFNSVFNGAESAYKNIIIEDAIKYEPVRLNEKDTEKMVAAQTWTLQEVCRRFGVPPFFAGDMTKATFANSEQQGTQLVQYCIQPRAKSWEDSFTAMFCRRETQYIKFSLSGLMRGDHAARSAFYQSAIQNGWMTPNEVRNLEDLNPIPGADTLMFPGNFTSLENAIKSKPGQNNPGFESAETPKKTIEISERKRSDLAFLDEAAVVTKSSRSKIEAIIRKQLKAEIDEIKRLSTIGQMPTMQIMADFRAFCESIAAEYGQQYLPIYQDILNRLSPIVQKKVNTGIDPAQEQLDAYASKYAVSMAGRHGSTRAGEIERALVKTDVAQVGEVVDSMADAWLESVPAIESQEETNRAGNAFNLFLFTQLGVSYMHVVANADACDFCQKLDGKVVEVNGAVLDKGSQVADGAGNIRVIKRSLKHPPFHGGCACGIAPGK